MLGPSEDFDVSLGAEEVAEFGLDAGISREVVVNPTTGKLRPVYDPESGIQPYTVKLGVSGGVDYNPFPKPVEASVNYGLSWTMVMVTVQMYPWNWPREGFVTVQTDFGEQGQ